jgi:ribosomal protein S18 acetylase RimI-like enzyme
LVTPVDIRILRSEDLSVLQHVARDVFDNDVSSRWSAEFLSDARHHLAVAIDDGTVVGMASGVHYVHPDKCPQFFINEVGVAPSHQGRRLGQMLVEALLERGRVLECSEAWVITDESNSAARRLYERCGGQSAPEPTVMYTFTLGATNHDDSGPE